MQTIHRIPGLFQRLAAGKVFGLNEGTNPRRKQRLCGENTRHVFRFFRAIHVTNINRYINQYSPIVTDSNH